MIRPGLATAIGLFAALAAAGPARANDPRLIERMYDAGKVITISGRTKVQATIEFGEDEHIENVAVGDSEAWQVTPNKRANLLFVKPLHPAARTNMTVVTDQRTYLFDLVAGAKASPIYVLRFRYPDAPRKPAAPAFAAAGAASAEELAAASEPAALSTDPATLNFAWTAKGDRKLLPARTYDDGAATFLAWPAGNPVPAILVKDYKGVEGPVNFAVRGDVIVLDGVPREIVLRSGKDAATLFNGGPLRPAAVPVLPAASAPTPEAAPEAALARGDTALAGGTH